MIGIKTVMQDLKSKDTESLIRAIIYLGSQFIRKDVVESPVPGVSDGDLKTEALAGVIYDALCVTGDDKGTWPDAVAWRWANEAMIRQCREKLLT